MCRVDGGAVQAVAGFVIGIALSNQPAVLIIIVKTKLHVIFIVRINNGSHQSCETFRSGLREFDGRCDAVALTTRSAKFVVTFLSFHSQTYAITLNCSNGNDWERWLASKQPPNRVSPNRTHKPESYPNRNGDNRKICN